jgi:NTP pyrophosphatase (non-canonical NTP hydrolase)
MTEQELIHSMTRWSHDRNLIKGGSVDKQFVKLAEELGEVAECISKGRPDELPQEIGDMIVVLNILAQQHGFTLQTAMSRAWEKIKDRKGMMINGVFVKESDLPGIAPELS